MQCSLPLISVPFLLTDPQTTYMGWGGPQGCLRQASRCWQHRRGAGISQWGVMWSAPGERGPGRNKPGEGCRICVCECVCECVCVRARVSV